MTPVEIALVLMAGQARRTEVVETEGMGDKSADARESARNGLRKVGYPLTLWKNEWVGQREQEIGT